MSSPASKRVHPRRIIRDADELETVEIGLALFPVVLELYADGANARAEFLAYEGARAVTLGEVFRAIGHNHEVIHGEDGGQIGICLAIVATLEPAAGSSISAVGAERFFRIEALARFSRDARETTGQSPLEIDQPIDDIEAQTLEFRQSTGTALSPVSGLAPCALPSHHLSEVSSLKAARLRRMTEA